MGCCSNYCSNPSLHFYAHVFPLQKVRFMVITEYFLLFPIHCSMCALLFFSFFYNVFSVISSSFLLLGYCYFIVISSSAIHTYLCTSLHMSHKSNLTHFVTIIDSSRAMCNCARCCMYITASTSYNAIFSSSVFSLSPFLFLCHFQLVFCVSLVSDVDMCSPNHSLINHFS